MNLDPRSVAAELGGEARGNQVSAPAPGHSKHDRSLSILIDPGVPDGFIVKAFAGEDDLAVKDYVRSKLGLPEWKPERPEPPRAKPKVVCHYVYQDDQNEPYLRVTRMSDKTFRQSHWEIDGWATGKPSGPVFPYRLPDMLSDLDATVWLVEGEKDADNLAALDLVATTAPGGGGNFPLTPEFARWFEGRKVVAIADNDATGAKWRERVQQVIPQAVHISMPAPHKDVSDWLKAGGDLATLEAMTEAPPPLTVAPEPGPITPTPFAWADPSTIPPREWVYDTHLIRKFVSLTVSPGGLGKSSLALVEALSMVTGRPLIEDAVLHEGPLKVWYWNGEDPQEETRRRVMAAALHYQLKPSDLSGLFTDSGRDQPLILGTNDREGIQLNEELFLHIEETMIAHGIDVFMADPFVSAHRLGENDNNAIDALVKRLGKLADRTNAAIEIVHHVRKPSNAKEDTDVNDARGASALLGGVRSARVLNVMSKDISGPAGVSEDMRLRHFSVIDGKANMTPRMDDLRWRRLESVNLGNATYHPDGTVHRKGDNVGVVTYYKLPKEAQAVADLSNAEAEMRILLSQHDDLRHWTGKRGAPPKNWLGHRVLEALGILDGDHDAAMRRLITSWIADQKVALRTAWEKGNQNIYLTLPADPFAAPNDPETPDDTPF